MNCPHCNLTLEDRPELAGMTFACPSCAGMFTVPAPLAVASHRPPAVSTERSFGIDAHRVSAPHSTVYVNVPKQHSNSFGTASMVLGVVGLLVCWIPFFGLPLAALGLLLGLFGFLASLGRGGSGMGTSIAGGFVSALVLVVAGSFWWFVAGGSPKPRDEAKIAAVEPKEPQPRKPRGDRPADQVWDFPNHPAPPSPAFAQGVVDANRLIEETPETAEPMTKPVPPEPKPWQASRKWLLDGKVVSGSLKSWNPTKVVIILATGAEVETTRERLSLSDRTWVESHFK